MFLESTTINKKRLKVLYIITNGNLGGAQVHLNELIVGLPDHVLVYVVMGERLWLWDKMLGRNVELFHVSTLVRAISIMDDIKTIYYLTKIINKVCPDIIHCHSSKAGLLGRIAGGICRKPVVFTVHGWAFTEGVPWKKKIVYQFIERLTARWTNRIICVGV